MATKKSDMMKKNADMVSARKSNRKAFVAQKTAEKGITPAQARQRFYVQTRMSEMKAKGKTVAPEMRKQLQQKFQSGDVARKGFAAPKKKAVSSSSSTSSSVVAPTGMGATSPRRNSSAQGGKFAPKKKAPMKGSKY